MERLYIVIVLILAFFTKSESVSKRDSVCDSVANNMRSSSQITLNIFCSFFLGACIGELICIAAHLRSCQSIAERAQE